MAEKIQAFLIFEILGRPKEHVEEALTNIVLRIADEKGVKLLEKTVHEPKEVEDSKSLFTTFADVMLEFDDIERFLAVVYTYMPANVEVISPETLKLRNTDLNDISNKLVYKLHTYDSIAKNMLNDREYLLKTIKELSPETFEKLMKRYEKNRKEQPEPPKTPKKKKKAKK
tara:strand:- start:4853 stop:5365 length:513 start_codon:yes stop_codon:yes gene_type:complete